MNLDFTFLTYEQVFGDNKLNIFERYGTNAAITDFAILLGGFVSDNSHYNNSKSLKNRSGWYWTKTPYFYNARVVFLDGNSRYHDVNGRDGGSRPALPFSSIQKISTNIVSGNDGIKEVEFGEYPQMAAPADIQVLLECTLDKRQTGKTYTIDSRKNNDNKEFEPSILYEYEYNGKKYVRVKANSDYDGVAFTLSNGQEYRNEDYVWVEVQPIKWLVDEKYGIAVSERLLFAGIQFDEKAYTGDFENTRIKRFMDECFSKEILQSIKQKGIDLSELEKEEKEKLKKYGLDKESIDEFRKKIKKVTEEESNQLGQKLYELIHKKEYNENANFDEVLKLILDGANIEHKEDKKGNYSLLVCSRKNYLKTFILLLKAGANINQVNKYLTTCTMSSARHGNKEILELLILMKADINARCLDGDTAIMCAKRHGQEECFNMLVNASASLTNKNQKGQTLSDLDGNDSKFNIENLLINKNDEKANINSDDIIGEALSKMNEILGDDKELIIDQIHNDEKFNRKTKTKIFKYSADKIKWDDIDD